MANIRPALYIGIGGTGITAIAKTKKMFEEAYGKTGLHRLPVRFICIDYDLASEKDTKNATDISEDFVQITNLASPRRLYREQRKNGRFNWFYPQNARFMDDKISDGAAQVRGYGRFLTEMIIDEIKTKIDNAIDQITQLSQDLQEQNTNISKVDCHVVMSIAGGTGCGSFLNVAWALRQKQEVNIIGYGVLHSVFRAIDPTRNQTPRVVSNAYSAVLDLDYLMNATEANPIRLSLNLLERDLTQPIYDQFYVIDNKTTDNRTVTDCGSLCDVIATCLFSAGGSPGEKVNAIMNNVGWNKGGDYSIMHKNGWTQGLGACQIIYDGESLADIYADKAAIEIIKQLRNSDTDVAQTAIAWTEDNNVREDGDQYNYLIDSIYSPSKLRGLSSPDVDVKATMTDTRETVKVYLNSNHDFPNEDTTLLLQNTLCEALKKSVDAM